MSVTLQIPVPLVGPNLTTLAVTPIDIGQTGVGTLLTANTVYVGTPTATTTDMVKGLTYRYEPELQEINALNTFNRNEVTISQGASLTVEVYKVNNGNDVNPLLQAIYGDGDGLGGIGGYNYMQVAWSEGNVSSHILAFQFYGVVSGWDSSMAGRGMQLGTMTLAPVDFGLGNGNLMWNLAWSTTGNASIVSPVWSESS